MSKIKKTLILEDDSYYFEDAKITRAEVLEQKKEVIQKNGAIKLELGSKVKKRINSSLTASIQKKTLSVDRKSIEAEAEKIVFNRMIEHGLIKSISDLSDIENPYLKELQSKHRIAVVNEISKSIKQIVPNRFYFKKNEMLKIAKMSSNNTYHLEKVLNDMRSEKTAIVIEKRISQDFKTIYEEKMNVSFITGYGFKVEIEPNLFSSNTTNEIEINQTLSFKDLPTNAEIVIEIHPDFLPYLINPHKNKYTEGFIQVYNKYTNKFNFEHSDTLYKFILDISMIWRNTKFTYMQLLKRFPSNYGKKKKLNPKFEVGMPINKKYLRNSRYEYIYELDKNQNFIYEDDYLKTYRFFKNDILNPAIEEINQYSEYTVSLIEHRRKNLKNGILEFVQFEIQKKKVEEKEVGVGKYINIAYYVAARIAMYNIINNKQAIENIPSFATKNIKPLIEKEQDDFFLSRKIAGLGSMYEANCRVEENHIAIKNIKELLFQNHKETATLWFDEEYMVVFNKGARGRKTSTSKHRIYPHLGEDAIQCWNELLKQFPKLIGKNNSQDKADISTYLNFEYYTKDENRFITISKNNYSNYANEISTSIANKEKRCFKGFKNMNTKKEFFENFIEV